MRLPGAQLDSPAPAMPASPKGRSPSRLARARAKSPSDVSLERRQPGSRRGSSLTDLDLRGDPADDECPAGSLPALDGNFPGSPRPSSPRMSPRASDRPDSPSASRKRQGRRRVSPGSSPRPSSRQPAGQSASPRPRRRSSSGDVPLHAIALGAPSVSLPTDAFAADDLGLGLRQRHERQISEGHAGQSRDRGRGRGRSRSRSGSGARGAHARSPSGGRSPSPAPSESSDAGSIGSASSGDLSLSEVETGSVGSFDECELPEHAPIVHEKHDSEGRAEAACRDPEPSRSTAGGVEPEGADVANLVPPGEAALEPEVDDEEDHDSPVEDEEERPEVEPAADAQCAPGPLSTAERDATQGDAGSDHAAVHADIDAESADQHVLPAQDSMVLGDDLKADADAETKAEALLPALPTPESAVPAVLRAQTPPPPASPARPPLVRADSEPARPTRRGSIAPPVRPSKSVSFHAEALSLVLPFEHQSPPQALLPRAGSGTPPPCVAYPDPGDAWFDRRRQLRRELEEDERAYVHGVVVHGWSPYAAFCRPGAGAPVPQWDGAVRVEDVRLRSRTAVGITVVVRNLAFRKRVVVRYSFDGWATWDEREAGFLGKVCPTDDHWDRFLAEVEVDPALFKRDPSHPAAAAACEDPVRGTAGGRMVFAVRYEAPGVGEWWENNAGRNFVCEFRRRRRQGAPEPAWKRREARKTERVRRKEAEWERVYGAGGEAELGAGAGEEPGGHGEGARAGRQW